MSTSPSTRQAPALRRTRSLPIEVTSFIGRRRELGEVRRILGNARLLTLTGVGGVGKTRLALRAAAESRRDMTDGVVFVELADLRNGDGLVSRLATEVGLDCTPSEQPWAVLRRHLRDMRILLVLDNCEHLLDASADLAATLLSVTEHLRILTTSRQPLGIAGEHILAVPALSLPGPAQPTTPATLDQFDAVSLFVDRARAVVADFEVTEANCATVVQLCRQLDGIPLAIELAAARLRAFSVGQILGRLNSRYTLLTTGNRVAEPRQRTLRALIDWSFGLCSEAERTLWTRLSVFAGGFDLAAAESVCGGAGLPHEDVFDVLGALVDKSIVIRTDRRSGVDYHMLETIRQYGHDRLGESGELTTMRHHHLAWFTTMVGRADTEWMGAEQARWYERSRTDADNLATALEFCLAETGDTETALDLAVEFANRRRAYSSLGEARQWLDKVLARTSAPSPHRAKALWMNCWLALQQGDREVAEQLAAECAAVASATGDAVSAAYATHATGLSLVFRGELDAAVPLLRDAQDQHDRLDQVDSARIASGQLVMALCFAGSPDGTRMVDVGMSTITQDDKPASYGYLLWYAAVDRFVHGDPAAAGAHAAEALRHAGALGDRWLTMMCVETLAWCAAAEGGAGRASRLLGVGAALRQAMDCRLEGLDHLRAHHLACANTARHLLGAEAYDAAFRLGADLDMDQAISYATHSAAVPPQATRANPLTKREFEIARLVARGMTNREIAADLVIAQRTAETHVERILTKLGFTRRTQIASWVTGLGALEPR